MVLIQHAVRPLQCVPDIIQPNAYRNLQLKSRTNRNILQSISWRVS